MRLIFKIIWKIALGIVVALGLVIVIGVTALGYLAKSDVLTKVLESIGLDNALGNFTPVIQQYGYYIAAGGTIFLIILVVAGIFYAILESRRIRKYKRAYKQLKQSR